MSQRVKYIIIGLAGLVLLAVLIYQVPAVNAAVAWRADKFSVYVKNLVDPVGPVPTALPVTQPAATPTTVATQTQIVTNLEPTLLPTATLPPLPAQAFLPSPPYEQQTPNNCGPAALSMMLHMFGWDGSQADIAQVIKPVLQDRN